MLGLTGFHLPDINGAVRTTNNHEVVQRAPLDGDYGKQVSGCENNALALCQAEKCYRVVAGYRADALPHPHLQ